jgi:hypothetical protein
VDPTSTSTSIGRRIAAWISRGLLAPCGWLTGLGLLLLALGSWLCAVGVAMFR